MRKLSSSCSHKADAELKGGDFDRTPLSWAAEKRHGGVHVVKQLLEAGAKVNLKDKFGQTLLARANTRVLVHKEPPNTSESYHH